MSYYQGLQADAVTFRGHNGGLAEAYYAGPTRAGKFPGVVVIHHMPGWDEWITEVVRKFAHHGTPRFRITFIFAKVPAVPTISARGCAPPVG